MMRVRVENFQLTHPQKERTRIKASGGEFPQPTPYQRSETRKIRIQVGNFITVPKVVGRFPQGRAAFGGQGV